MRAYAGIQKIPNTWIPAYAGMTGWELDSG